MKVFKDVPRTASCNVEVFPASHADLERLHSWMDDLSKTSSHIDRNDTIENNVGDIVLPEDYLVNISNEDSMPTVLSLISNTHTLTAAQPDKLLMDQ